MVDSIGSLSSNASQFNPFKVSSADTLVDAIREKAKEETGAAENDLDQSKVTYRRHVEAMQDRISDARTGLARTETAMTAVQEVKTSLTRMRDIAEQVSDSNLGEEERANLTEEFAALAAGVNETVQNTRADGKTLLDGKEGALANLNAAQGLALDESAVQKIETALQDTNLAEGNLQSRQDRQTLELQNNTRALNDYQSSEEKISSYETASNNAQATRNMLLARSSMATLAQSNIPATNALFLLS
jgi:hypothetical protein